MAFGREYYDWWNTRSSYLFIGGEDHNVVDGDVQVPSTSSVPGKTRAYSMILSRIYLIALR